MKLALAMPFYWLSLQDCSSCMARAAGQGSVLGIPRVSLKDLLCQGPQTGVLWVRNQELQVGRQQQTLLTSHPFLRIASPAGLYPQQHISIQTSLIYDAP